MRRPTVLHVRGREPGAQLVGGSVRPQVSALSVKLKFVSGFRLGAAGFSSDSPVPLAVEFGLVLGGRFVQRGLHCFQASLVDIGLGPMNQRMLDADITRQQSHDEVVGVFARQHG